MIVDPFGCPNKQQSRNAIWHWMALRHPPGKANVLFFPGSSVYETETILACGYPPECLFMVEKNAAVKSNYTRRADKLLRAMPPNDHFYRMLLSEAAQHLRHRDIQIHAAHLDFCTNCASEEMFFEIQALLKSGVMAQRSHVAITVLSGREHDIGSFLEMNQYLSVVNHRPMTPSPDLSQRDRGRLFRLWTTIGAELRVQHLGQYHNTRTNNSMLWAIFEVIRST